MSQHTVYRVGVAKSTITPVKPMWAGGYGHRERPVSEREHDLFAKALVLEDEVGCRLVFVTTDLAGLSNAMADATADRICKGLALDRSQVALTCSHTHSGPALNDSLVHIYPLGAEDLSAIEAYSNLFPDRIVDAVARAAENLTPATLAHGRGRAGFAMNRRESTDQGVVIGCNPAGPVDHDVPVLRVTSPDGDLRAVSFGYACHGTTMDFYKWCGDYEGFAQANLERAHPGATALFHAGCGADVNPHPRWDLAVCRRHGRELADAVEQVLSIPMIPVTGQLTAGFERIDLPFESLPDRQEVERQRQHGRPFEQTRARRLLEQLDKGVPLAPSYPYSIQIVRMGDALTMIVLAGEVVTDYAHSFKNEFGEQRTWGIAYANDVCGYIPTRRVLEEGGYEADEAMAVYTLPGRWDFSIEERILTAVRNLVQRTRNGISPQ